MANSPDDKLPLPIEIIFSCSICQATATEIYQENEETSRDRPSTHQEAPVTKLWLTECTHLTCAKHLEGGGVPYYAPGETPRAPCPLCTIENGDNRKKNLYGIRGCLEGTYNPEIHKSWFDTPPIKLDGSGKGMEALRFHYISLIRFGTTVAVKLRKARAAVDDARKKAVEEVESRQRLENELEHMRRRALELEQCEKDLKSWRERESKIKYFLNILPEVARENEKLREQLTAMGYAVPKRTYSLDNVYTREVQAKNRNNQSSTQNGQKDAHQNAKHHPEVNEHGQNGRSPSRTLSGPAEPVGNLHVPASSNAGAQKRKHVEEPLAQDEPVRRSPRLVRGENRQMIPPSQPVFDRGSHNNTVTNQTQSEMLPNQPPFLATPNIRTHSDGRNLDGSSMNHPEQSWHRETVQRREGDTRTFGDPSSQTDKQQTYEEERHRSNRISFLATLQGFSNDNRPSLETHRPDGQPESRSHISSQELQNVGYEPPPQNYIMHNGYEQSSHFSRSARQPQPQNIAAAFGNQLPYYTHLDDQRSFSSPIRHHGTFRGTPSPIKQPYFSEKESVASPFFSKTGAVQHTGRITLPSRARDVPSSRQQQDIRPFESGNPNFSLDAFRMPPPPRPAASSTRLASRGFNQASTTNTPRLQQQRLSTNHEPFNPFPTPSFPLSSRSKALAPSTPRNAEGLFQRFDQPPPSRERQQHPHTYPHAPPPHPHDPWLQQQQQPPSTPRPFFSANNTTASQVPSTPQYAYHRPGTDQPFTFPEHSARNNNNNIYTFNGATTEQWTPRHSGTPAGAKSGVSRPSREWERERVGVGPGSSLGMGLGERRKARR